MNITVQAIKDGEMIERRTWTEGRYTIGRNEICNMWLNDPHISSTHAELEVGKRKVVVHDMHSRNGIFFNDQKIEKKMSFTKDFEVELGPFFLKVNFQKGQKPVCQRNAAFQNRLFSNIRVLLTTSLILMVVLASVTVFMVMNYQTRAFKEEELRKRGNLFSLYLAKLAETDADSIILDAKAIRLIKHIADEEGVVWAVIADHTSRIIAPQGINTEKIAWKGFSKAIQEKERKSEDLANRQRIIFYPIKNDNKVLGGAVIQLDMHKAVQSGMGVSFLMLLVILVCICLLVGRYITRFFLTPLNLLTEEVSVAMKAKRGRINFHSPHPEIAELVYMFNRLLQNFRGEDVNTEKSDREDSTDIDNTPQSDDKEFKEQSEIKKDTKCAPPLKDGLNPARREEKNVFSPSSDTPTPNSRTEIQNNAAKKAEKVVNTEILSKPQCQIDADTLVIIDCNTAFREHFCKTGAAKQMNFAEVFEDPLISNAVYELLVGNEKEISVDISDTCAYLIQKRNANHKKGFITIRFMETQHEQ